MKKAFKFILNTIPRPILIRLSIVVRPILAFLLKGNRFTDPIDGKSFRMFLPYGYGTQRNNVLSPSTLSLERHRLLWLYLQNETDFFTKSNLSVLHIAPEQCFYGKFKAQKNLNYLTGDLVSPLADIHFDLHQIPLEDNRFEVVFCNHVMEHVDDPIQCMKELYRVMKPGGWAIMQVPQDMTRETTYEDASIVDPAEREKHFWQKDHVRLFGRDYPQWLEKAGFIVDVYDVQKNFDKQTIDRFRLMKDELLYIAKKA